MRWHLNQKKQFRTDHPMNDDYEEPVVIDEDELDEEVLREMMDEDDREGEELWKKISRRDDTHKKRK